MSQQTHKVTLSDSVLVVGIGSAHYDDAAGWHVVDQLLRAKRGSSATSKIRFCKAAVPHDLLDWLDPSQATHLVDARSGGPDRVVRFEVADNAKGVQLREVLKRKRTESTDPTDELLVSSQLQSSSSHQFGLLATLQLARALGSLPQSLILWTIPICFVQKTSLENSSARSDLSTFSCGSLQALTASTQTYVARCAEEMLRELEHA